MTKTLPFSRRRYLAGLVCFTVYPSIASAEDKPAEEGIIAAIATFAKTNPYVAAAMAAFQLYGAIKTARFQRKTKGQLEEISRQINQLSRKFDQVIALLLDLPEVFRTELRRQRAGELTSDIRVENSVIAGVLRKYASPRPPIALSALDRDTLNDSARRTIRAAESLSDWGAYEFLPVGQAYAQFLSISSLIGEPVQDIQQIQVGYFNRVQKAERHFRQLTEERRIEAAQIKRELDACPGIYFFQHFSTEYSTTNFYGELTGDSEKGFQFKPMIEHNGTHARSYPDYRTVPAWKSLKVNALLWSGRRRPPAWRPLLAALEQRIDSMKAAESAAVNNTALGDGAWATSQYIRLNP